MRQTTSMRLDHVSYVASHDQLADTVQRIGSRIGTTFVDGGIHPRFGTRNFTAPLIGGQYIEVVSPLSHPATEQTPWGKAVLKKASEGGGWLTWVFNTDNILAVEDLFGRKSVEGHRTRPDGSDLKWKQIGVTEISKEPELPFFIEWQTPDHPSKDGFAVSQIKKIVLSDTGSFQSSLLKEQILSGLKDGNIEIQLSKSEILSEGIRGIILSTPSGFIELD